MIAMLSVALLAAPPLSIGDRHALVGVVTEQAHLKCVGGDGPFGGGDEVWGEPYYELGFVRLVPGAGVDPAAAVGRAVVAVGAPADGPAPARPTSCHMMQMRDDWVYGKSGMRVRRGAPPHVAFGAEALHVVELLAADYTRGPTPADDRLHVTLRNPFDRPLTAVALTLHHEGCYGKPGSTAETARREALGPGEAWTVALPAFVSRAQGRGHWHAASAITLDATAARIAFDLDLPVRRLGVEVDCDRAREAADGPALPQKKLGP